MRPAAEKQYPAASRLIQYSFFRASSGVRGYSTGLYTELYCIHMENSRMEHRIS